MSSKQRFVRCPKCLNVLPEPADVPVYKCGGCGATLQGSKKRNNSTVDSTSHRPDNNSSGKQKVDQDFGDQIQEAGSSSNQQLQLNNSNDESDQSSDHDAANVAKNASIDAPSSSKQKQKQLSDDHEASISSSLHKHSPVNSTDEPRRNVNDPRSSTELSGHEDPESSPEATGHTRIDQPQEQTHNDHSSGEQKTEQLSNQKLTVNSTNDLDQNNDHHKPHNSSELSHHEDPDSDLDPDQDYTDDLDQFLSCRHDVEFEETSSEFEESYANKIVRDSDYGSRSSFKSIIADKLLDTKRKKPVNLENDDVLSELGSSDLNHRRIFDRITSNYYGYEGSVSSYDGNEIQNPRRPRIGQIEDEYVDRFNRSVPHHMNNRLGKQKHRSTEIHRNPNPKLERIQLLKKVRELTDQLERTSVSSPHGLNDPVRFGRRMAFSGETTAVNRRLDGGTCHHCCPPRDRTFSAQLPRQAQHVCCNGPHFEPNTYYSPRVSGLSTPVHTHPESGFSTPDGGYGYSYSYKHRNDVAKPFRSPMKTRYVRPIANGSPWITCYRCYKLLELPQSFLVFNKKCHSLRCGACMEVLKFTLLNGTHVSRYYPEEAIAAPPSSEVEDYNELNRSRAGPVSCSDVSFQKSYSTETDRNGFWEFGEERRKATMSRDPSGSSQPSSSKISGRRKMMSEIEVERRPNGSPLHRLMGYSTPSKVIRG
ncbi:putative zinc-ribbon domain, plant, protein enhanced disease resistance 4 [Helianthus annuus]|nr:putative zinc-ribbon domain, plant, protein enhanced disease resistance 4 [Helianthus annuus]